MGSSLTWVQGVRFRKFWDPTSSSLAWINYHSVVFFVLATFTADRLSSPKPVHLRSKENLSKSFVIRRRPLSNDNEPNLLKSQVFNYNQQNTFDLDDDDDDESEDERRTNDLSKTIFNIQPSAYYTSQTHVF
jgi:hypothetical protein